MTQDPGVPAEMLEQIKAALESGDLSTIGDLLDPEVRWGAPGDRAPSCQNRRQVLAWYRRGRQAGARARVTEIAAHGHKILVGLQVLGTPEAERRGGEVERWQVLTVAGAHIVDIRGFDDRREADAAVGTRARLR
jgi:hypothetical protein